MPAYSDARFIASASFVKDVWWGGIGIMSGIIKISPNTPFYCKVRLLDLKTCVIIKETWSDPSGQFVFSDINETREYLIVALDHTNTYEPAAASGFPGETIELTFGGTTVVPIGYPLYG
jgi:hypothetical protein